MSSAPTLYNALGDNGEPLLTFAANHEIEPVNTFFSRRKNGISHTFNGWSKESIDYILPRQRDRKLVRDVVVHPQPLCEEDTYMYGHHM